MSPIIDWAALTPLLLIFVTAVVGVLVEAFAPRKARRSIQIALTFIAISFFEDRVLLLKRNQEPLCWGPPSGHMKLGETMERAIHREMMEETGNTCKILMAVDTWQGRHRGREVFNVTYVCEMTSFRVDLSEEHSDFMWIPVDALASYQDLTLLDMRNWPLLIALAKEYRLKQRDAVVGGMKE